ncbi:hypothetical protein [Thiohalomonas denitrificans]|uniref:hypothetical protein n=1 Tax=Thiohalomonas denitrificans TaxID=415747 RepID=UPI0026F36FA6|nr:hypothetical protein [Thiohalomonas denitrificans]
MRSKLPDAPVLKSMPTRIIAAHYNRVQIALKKLGHPLHLMLPGMRGFQVYIEDDAWICADRNLNNLPILAWTEFRPGTRDGLNESVPCQLLYYHPYANVVIRTVLEDSVKILNARMRRAGRGVKGRIVAFPGIHRP